MIVYLIWSKHGMEKNNDSKMVMVTRAKLDAMLKNAQKP